MSYEIEAKIKVAALGPIENKLKELNADFVQSVQQTAAYFMDRGEQLRKNDCGLRIRQQTINNEPSALISCKFKY